MDVGEQIKNYRKKAGLSQKKLGEKLGVSQQHIAQYENGKRTPKLETIEKIAHALNVQVIDLMGLSTYISEIEKELNKRTSFFDFLESMGYLIHDNFDGKWGIHIEESNTNIYITNEEMDILERTAKENIDLRITKYKSDGKHNQ